MSGTKNFLKLRMHVSLLASMGFAALFSLAQTDAALAATAPSLGTAATFAVLGGSAVTNTGNSVITGNLGVSPGATVTGFFPPGIVTPPSTIHIADAVALQAQSDLVTAYNDLAGQVCDTDLTGQDLGGMTLTPGAYCFSAAAQLTGSLTLDAQGSATAVFVFQIGSTLTAINGSSVVVINGGSNCNVFWQVGSSATIGTNTTFAGNILAFTSITLNTGANVSGRALARDGAVTMDDNNIEVCAAAIEADMEVSKTGETLVPGTTGQLVYTILATNNGPGTASSVSLDDVIPAGVGGNLSNVNYTLDGGLLTPWSSPSALGDMNFGSSHTVLIYADVPNGMTSIGVNTATVSSATADPNSGNNSDTCINGISGGTDADLSVTLTCPALTVVQVCCHDEPPLVLAYTITVVNNGPNTAPAVSLADIFPDGLIKISYRIDGGISAAWNSPLALGSMNSGASHVIQIYAEVDPATISIDSNTATVSDPGISDPTLVNNSDTCNNPIILAPVISQRAMNFSSGSGADVSVTQHSTLNLAATGTLEAWIYPTSFTADAGIVIKGTSAACYGFGFGGGTLFSGGASDNIGFVLYDNTGTKHLLTDTTDTLVANKWYHVACVWDLSPSPTMAIYINGILGDSSAAAIPNVRANAEDLMIGTQNITPAAFSGVIDEVRVWNTARSVANIRTFMCKKVVPSTTPDPNLVCNLRFDEDSGTLASDFSGNGNIGIITSAVRVCSSAPIGDDSTYSYTGPYTATLAGPAPDIDNLTISAYGGTWDAASKSGIQVYRVDSRPNYTTPPYGWNSFVSSVRYWGTFIIGGISPTYTMSYYYDGYPGIVNENTLKIGFRDKYCDTQWQNLQATLDTTLNTLTKSGLSGTEFILGSFMDPRNCVQYNGSSQYMEVSYNSVLDLSDTGTLEAWIYPNAFTTDAGIVFKGTSEVCYGFGLAGAGVGGVFTGGTNTVIGFVLGQQPNGASRYLLLGSQPLTPANVWHHIACVWNRDSGTSTGTMTIYINGVEDATQTIPMAAAINTNADALRFAMQAITTAYFHGQIDEVRVWNVVRSQDQIRNTMCHKLAGTESGLAGYWRFDEETTDANSPDYSGIGNTAAMYGFATTGDVIAGRVCSSAPIGNASARDYFDGGPGTVSATLTHTDGDYMFATENGGYWFGTFSGIQVYRVDSSPVYPPDISGPLPYDPYTTPNGLTPPHPPNAAAYWSSVDYYRYWGIFLTDWLVHGAEPTYDAVYNYNGNPSVPTNENNLGLAKRDSYCDRTWADSGAGLNSVSNTFSVSGETQNFPSKIYTEYILGGTDQPLAIALASFTVEGVDVCIEIAWETATELDTMGFELWRSESKEGPYTRVAGSFQRSKSVIATQGAAYSYTDCDVALGGNKTYYYKLEEIDMDTDRKNPLYGPIGPVPDAISAAQVSDSNGAKKDKACFLSIISE